jgi:hypothetical protein
MKFNALRLTIAEVTMGDFAISASPTTKRTGTQVLTSHDDAAYPVGLDLSSHNSRKWTSE